jgi:hypothetical protein
VHGDTSAPRKVLELHESQRRFREPFVLLEEEADDHSGRRTFWMLAFDTREPFVRETESSHRLFLSSRADFEVAWSSPPSRSGACLIASEIAGVGPTRLTVFRAKDTGQRGDLLFFAAFHYGTVFARLDRWCDRKCHTNARAQAMEITKRSVSSKRSLSRRARRLPARVRV